MLLKTIKVFYNSKLLEKSSIVNQYEPVVSDHHFKKTIFNLQSFEGFVNNFEREIRVRDFSKRNGDGMTGHELGHDSHKCIIVHWVKREQLGSFSENDFG